MRSFVFITAFLLLVPRGFSQEVETLSKKEIKKLAKEEKQARMQAELEIARTQTEQMLKYHRFVLEANYLGNQRGDRIPVNSRLNFIAIDSLTGTLQLGNPYGIGHNGVGGVTLDGKITKYDLKINQRKKGKTYSLMIVIMTSVGIYDITFHISESGFADATVRGNTSGQLRYSGKLVPLGISDVYKGSSLF